MWSRLPEASVGKYQGKTLILTEPAQDRSGFEQAVFEGEANEVSARA
jgi:hypothetical protein